MPFETKLNNYLEIFNEACILGNTYHLLLFTDWIKSDFIQNIAGYSILGLTATNILVNTVVMIVMTVKKVRMGIRRLRMKWLQRKHRQLLKKYEGHLN